MPDTTDMGGTRPRTYKAAWKGQLVLACRECRKRWKADGKKNKLDKLGKEMKSVRRSGSFSIVNVSCLKLCPKGGVTMCTVDQLARNECSIVRSKRDLRQLLESGEQSMRLSEKG